MSVLKIKLGEKVLELTSDKVGEELVADFAFWSSLPAECSKCKSKDLSLFSRKLKKGSYSGLKCMKCTAELTFHQYMESKLFYLTPEDAFKVYQKEGE